MSYIWLSKLLGKEKQFWACWNYYKNIYLNKILTNILLFHDELFTRYPNVSDYFYDRIFREIIHSKYLLPKIFYAKHIFYFKSGQIFLQENRENKDGSSTGMGLNKTNLLTIFSLVIDFTPRLMSCIKSLVQKIVHLLFNFFLHLYSK